ncbi:HAD-IB family hydrolase [Orbus sturtevantii]|uniref:HAD family hydrolase n=1 Tax=Orbus sturtevantii TaxID=3074109 RepID=UPI00370D1CB2
MFDFFQYWVIQQNLPKIKLKFDHEFKVAREKNSPREELNRMYYRFFKGHSLNSVELLGVEWFKEKILSPNFFINKTLQRLKEHKNKGDKIVFVSGSMSPLLQPIANHVGADDLLCTDLIVDIDRNLTGEIGPIQTIGAGKSDVMNKFALANDIKLSDCYGYGDDFSDMYMLLLVGNPVYVGNQPQMLDIANINNWEILN